MTSKVHSYGAVVLSLALGGCLLDRAGTMTPGAADANVADRDGSVPCSPSAEVCDGVDNDCDPSTPDGADEAATCDSPDDADSCEDDRTVCNAGVLSCMDVVGAAAELCDGVDNDCDPSTLDGADEPDVGRSCADAGLCGAGAVVCAAGALACDGVATESCNGRDDNCDGSVDENGCDCARVLATDGRRYLFCGNLWQIDTFDNARNRCRGWGYELVSIESVEEHELVSAAASTRFNGRWWTGGTDGATEGSFRWSGTGAAFAFTNWASGEPNDFAFLEDCVTLDTDTEGSAAKGGWFDVACVTPLRFICEETP